MSTRVAAHPFKDALSELQQENEKSGLLPTSMMDCLRKLGDKGQEQIANTFKERDRNLLRSFENRVEDGEDCWRKMCATAKKHRLRPPDPKAFIVALLEIKGVADAYNSRAKGLGYLQVQYWKQMDKLKKGLDQKIRDAQSLDQVRLLKDDFDAQMRDLRAFGAAIQTAAQEAPRSTKDGSRVQTLFKGRLSGLVHELCGEWLNCEVATFMEILLGIGEKDADSVRNARRRRFKKTRPDNLR
jgi:hypothetical protein